MISVAGIATNYRTDGQSSIPGSEREYFLLRIVQTCPGANLDSYSMTIGATSPRVKWQGREGDDSPSSIEVKNGEAIPPLPHMLLWYSG
jgi:hypothetical protein